MHRRQVLASAAALLPATAGCLGSLSGESARLGVVEAPTASLTMESHTDAAIARELTHHEFTDDERALLGRIVDDGSATVGWYREPPVYAERTVLYDDAVYHLEREATDSKPATTFSVVLDIPDGTPDDAETIRFADLPTVDRELFAARGYDDGDIIGIGTTLTYTPEEVERSALVPDPDVAYIEWENGEVASWAVDDSWDVELHRYRYTAERVATASDYGADVREEFLFELSGLPEAERSIVETAIADEYGFTVDAEATPSPTFASLVDRFRPHEEVAVHDEPDPDVGGRYLVRYDGGVYWTGLRWAADADRSDEGGTDDVEYHDSDSPTPTRTPADTSTPDD